MSLTQGTRRALLRGGKRYIDKVLGSNPIAYWPLDEKSGTVARCYVNPAQNGTYARDVSVMTTGAGIGDGNTAPLFNGVSDWADVLTAAFTAAFSVTAGSAMIWCRVANVGVWTDGTARRALSIRTDGANQTHATKDSVNNQLLLQAIAGGSGGAWTPAYSSTAWFNVTTVWNRATNTSAAYINGAQTGADSTFGVWAGALVSVSISSLGGGGNWWSGWLSNCAVWNRALAPAEIAALAVV